MRSASKEVLELGDALMDYHLKHKDLLGDSEEMSFREIAEISGIPTCDIIKIYESAISKVKAQWKKIK